MYTVISTHPVDGVFINEFTLLGDAESFAEDVSDEGFYCTLCKQLRSFSPKEA